MNVKTKNISAKGLDFKELNQRIKANVERALPEIDGIVCIDDCLGQRFVGCGMSGKSIIINGTPGNALGAYLDGGEIVVNGNAQDAVGDTMNDGRIIIHGSAGDALGYARRGGVIYVKGNAGYRTGIHMKEYRDKKPAIVIGGSVGSFLGEYLAGGLIVVLGIGCESVPVGNFTGTGMHGGRIFIRTRHELTGLPAQVSAKTASEDEINEIKPYVSEFAGYFGADAEMLINEKFQILNPNAKNPYKQLYTAN
jgi:glutamate synthase domain-containing protein 3